MIKIPNLSFKLIIFSTVLMGVTFVLKLRRLPPQIPLLYSRPRGELQLADLLMIFIFPILSFLFVFANNVIFERYFKENEFVRSVIQITNIFIIVITTIVFLRIVFLVS